VKQQLLKNQRPDSKMIERKNQTDNATERYWYDIDDCTAFEIQIVQELVNRN
jgi:hypothetical protein